MLCLISVDDYSVDPEFLNCSREMCRAGDPEPRFRAIGCPWMGAILDQTPIELQPMIEKLFAKKYDQT